MQIGYCENFAPSAHSDAHWWDLDTWRRHLDDMAAKGYTVLVLYLRWYTTGYRSAIPFLDSTPSATAESDNALLNQLIEHAHRVGIKVFAANHAYIYMQRMVSQLDRCFIDDMPNGTIYWPHDTLVTLSADSGYTREIVFRTFEEQWQLFPGLDGFIYEGERKWYPGPGSEREYQRWAGQARKSYRELAPERFIQWCHERSIPAEWVEFVSHREGRLVRDVLGSLRSRGFGGEMFYCYGTVEFSADHMIDPSVFRAAAGPEVGFLPYNYHHPTPPHIWRRITELKQHGGDLMYFVDGQVGWHGAVDEKSPAYMDGAWAEYVRQGRELDPRYLLFFGYEWNSLRNGVPPAQNRERIHQLLTSA